MATLMEERLVVLKVELWALQKESQMDELSVVLKAVWMVL